MLLRHLYDVFNVVYLMAVLGNSYKKNGIFLNTNLNLQRHCPLSYSENTFSYQKRRAGSSNLKNSTFFEEIRDSCWSKAISGFGIIDQMASFSNVFVLP